MVYSWEELEDALQRASVIAIGPGLGQSPQAKELMSRIKGVDLPMVIDADALQIDFLQGLITSQAVITPHPGEAARLLGSSSREVQQNRLSMMKQLSEFWPGATVLKGAGTLVGEAGQTISLCCYGHAGMAVAGMGDVLTGIIAGLLGQGVKPINAAKLGVVIHARAAEAYANAAHPYSLIASDIVELIGSVLPSD
jgi:NAD(P)H-hydrate epimerase